MTVFPHPVPTAWKLLAQHRKDKPEITNRECAALLGVNENTIRHWIAKPLYQSYENWYLERTYESLTLERKRNVAEVKEELDEFAQEMLGRLKDIVETTQDEKLMAHIAFDALNRAGYTEPKREQQRSIQLVLTADVVEQLVRRQREISSGEVIEVGEAVGHSL